MSTDLAARKDSELTAWLGGCVGVEPTKALETVKAICFKGHQSATNEQLIAFLHVCRRYELDPLVNQVHAFTQGGAVRAIIGYDGWSQLANSHPQYDGCEFVDEKDGTGNVTSVTCKIYRKDRAHPTCCTEYLNECKGNTDPWKRWPARMLRNKAFIQAARLAFGFAGTIDPDEADRWTSATGPQTAAAFCVAKVAAVALPMPEVTTINGTAEQVPIEQPKVETPQPEPQKETEPPPVPKARGKKDKGAAETLLQ